MITMNYIKGCGFVAWAITSTFEWLLIFLPSMVIGSVILKENSQDILEDKD